MTLITAELCCGAIETPELVGGTPDVVLGQLESNAEILREIHMLAERFFDAGWILSDVIVERKGGYTDASYVFSRDGFPHAEHAEAQLVRICDVPHSVSVTHEIDEEGELQRSS